MQPASTEAAKPILMHASNVRDQPRPDSRVGSTSTRVVPAPRVDGVEAKVVPTSEISAAASPTSAVGVLLATSIQNTYPKADVTTVVAMM